MTTNEIKILEEIRDKYCHWDEVVVIDDVIKDLKEDDMSRFDSFVCGMIVGGVLAMILTIILSNTLL